MAIEDVRPVAIGEWRGLSTAAGGTALSTAAAFVPFLPQMDWFTFSPWNFSTAVVAKIALNPWLAVVKTTDALVTDALSVDNSVKMQDADTSTTMSMNSFGAGTPNFVYVGSHIQFRGVVVTIGNTNSNASTLAVKYWTGSAWATISPTDGTTSGGATLAQTGNVTWTLPSDWAKASLNSVLNPANSGIGDTVLRAAIYMSPLYWTRWEVGSALDASVTVTGMLSMNRNTANYPEWRPGERYEQTFYWGPGGLGCIEALTDAGTGSLIVTGAVTGAVGKSMA